MTATSATRVLGAVIVLSGVFAFGPEADAAVCRGRMAGQGTGLGIAGQGTILARQNALADWARKVEARHGKRFANTAKARSVRYDCQANAIVQAKCVVSAVPCR